MEFLQYLRNDINPLEKLVYLKTKLFFKENDDRLSKISLAMKQFQILLDCFDFIEKIAIKSSLRDYEEKFKLCNILNFIKKRFKLEYIFSDDLILYLIHLIKDEISSYYPSHYLLFDHDNEYSLEKYKKEINTDRTLCHINNQITNYIDEYLKFYKTNLTEEQIFILTYEVFTVISVYNYRTKLRAKIINFHFDKFRIIFANIHEKLGFNPYGTISDVKSI